MRARRCAPGSARVRQGPPTGGRRPGPGKGAVVQCGGAGSGLGRPAEASARERAVRPGGDGTSDTSPGSSHRVENTRCGLRDQLAEVGTATLKRRARRPLPVLPDTRRWLPVHGCSSLTMWVASAGRTRPGSSLSRSIRKGSRQASQLVESRGTLDLGVAEQSEVTGRAKPSTSRGQPGGQCRAANEHFAASEHG